MVDGTPWNELPKALPMAANLACPKARLSSPFKARRRKKASTPLVLVKMSQSYSVRRSMAVSRAA